MADDATSPYGAFVELVRETIAAHKAGAEPPDFPSVLGATDGRRMSALLDEVLDELRVVSDRLDIVGRQSKSDAVQLLREQLATMQDAMRAANDVQPHVEALRHDLLHLVADRVDRDSARAEEAHDRLQERTAAALDQAAARLTEQIDQRVDAMEGVILDHSRQLIEERIDKMQAALLTRLRTAKVEEVQADAAVMRDSIVAGIAASLAEVPTRVEASVAAKIDEQLEHRFEELRSALLERVSATNELVSDRFTVLTTELREAQSSAASELETLVTATTAHVHDTATALQATANAHAEVLAASVAGVESAVTQKVEAVAAALAENVLGNMASSLAEQEAAVAGQVNYLAGLVEDSTNGLAESLSTRLGIAESAITSAAGARIDELATATGEQLHELQLAVAAKVAETSADAIARVEGLAAELTERIGAFTATLARVAEGHIALEESMEGHVARLEPIVTARVGELSTALQSRLREIDAASQQQLDIVSAELAERIAGAQSFITEAFLADAASRAQSFRTLAGNLHQRFDRTVELVSGQSAALDAVRDELDVVVRSSQVAVTEHLDRVARALVIAADEARDSASRGEHTLASLRAEVAAELAAELDRRFGDDDRLLSFLERVANTEGDIARVDGALRGVAEAHGAIARAVEDVRRDHGELNSGLRDLRALLQSEVRAALEKGAGGPRADLSSLVSEVAKLSLELARQQSWLRKVGGKLAEGDDGLPPGAAGGGIINPDDYALPDDGV